MSKNFGELSWSEEKEEAVTAVRNIGNFIGECGTAGEAPTKVEKNISFGPAAYSFVGNITAETALDTVSYTHLWACCGWHCRIQHFQISYFIKRFPGSMPGRTIIILF